DCPEGVTPSFDLQGAHLCAGFIDAHCHLGVFGDSLGFEGEDGNECTDPCTPHLRSIDAINPLDRGFSDARSAGVTTVATGPGSANPIAGQYTAMKTTGNCVDDMVIMAPLSMKFALGENPKSVYHDRRETPTTRMATAAIIRENLYLTNEYWEKIQRAEEDEDENPPDYDAKLEALLPLLKKELPMHIHAHRADDILTGVRIAKEFDLDFVIVHGSEGHLIAEHLKGVAVITGPNFGSRSKPELQNLSLENSHKLCEAGARVAICTDHPETPIEYLPLCGSLAVRGGMSPEQALLAITRIPAEILGLSRRIGTLAPGKDADFVITTGHPLDFTSKVIAVFINGKQVEGEPIPC
ncbi:MAG: amidohydrolase, partial [Eubacteriales bacterium]